MSSTVARQLNLRTIFTRTSASTQLPAVADQVRQATRAYQGFSDAVSTLRNSILSFFRGDATNYLKFFKGWVYACIMARADALADIGWDIKIRKGDSEEIVTTGHWLADLKKRPNALFPWLKWRDIIKSIEYWQSIAGVAILYTPLNGAPTPQQIWIVPPSLVRLVPSPNNAVGPFEFQWVWSGKRIDPREIVYMPLLGPVADLGLSHVQGIGRIEAAIDAIQVEHYIHAYLRNYFAKNAMPEFAIESDSGAEMHSNDWEKFLKRWLEKHQGAEAGVPVGYLPSGWKLREINTTQNKKELQILSEQNLKAICGIFKTPVGILTGQFDTAAPAASFNALSYTFRKGLSPIAGDIGDSLTAWARSFDPLVSIEPEPVEWTDPEEVRRDELHRLQTGRATYNSLRLEYGEETIGEDGDVIFANPALIPLKSLLVPAGDTQSTPTDTTVTNEASA